MNRALADAQTGEAVAMRAGKTDAPHSEAAANHNMLSSGQGAKNLMQGVAIFSQFLLEAEADYLCGALRHHRSEQRLNYRCGYHNRKIRSRIGEIVVRVPHLRNICIRPSMPKRINRLSNFIVDTLVQISRDGVRRQYVDALIKATWTLDLPDELQTQLSHQAAGLFELWRVRATPSSTPAAYSVY